MSAAILATTCATAASGGSGAHPNAMGWSNLYGSGAAQTQFLTAAGIVGGPASITMSKTGTALVYYTLNGDTYEYSGAFNLSNGDTLSWTVDNFASTTKSGTITVKSASGTFTVGTFNYVLTGNTD